MSSALYNSDQTTIAGNAPNKGELSSISK